MSKICQQFSTSARLRSDDLNFHMDTYDNNPRTPFEFTEANLKRIAAIIKNYPEGHSRAALIPTLDIAQRQIGWLPLSAMHRVAELLGVPRMRVYEVASFYTMFKRRYRGKYHVKVCVTTPCWLRGADIIMKAVESATCCKEGALSPDNMFGVDSVQCAGACANAPVFAIDDDYYEDVTVNDVQQIINCIRSGQIPCPGPRNGRFAAEPCGGLTTLLTPPPPPGTWLQPALAGGPSDPPTPKTPPTAPHAPKPPPSSAPQSKQPPRTKTSRPGPCTPKSTKKYDSLSVFALPRLKTFKRQSKQLSFAEVPIYKKNARFRPPSVITDIKTESDPSYREKIFSTSRKPIICRDHRLKIKKSELKPYPTLKARKLKKISKPRNTQWAQPDRKLPHKIVSKPQNKLSMLQKTNEQQTVSKTTDMPCPPKKSDRVNISLEKFAEPYFKSDPSTAITTKEASNQMVNESSFPVRKESPPSEITSAYPMAKPHLDASLESYAKPYFRFAKPITKPEQNKTKLDMESKHEITKDKVPVQDAELESKVDNKLESTDLPAVKKIKTSIIEERPIIRELPPSMTFNPPELTRKVKCEKEKDESSKDGKNE